MTPRDPEADEPFIVPDDFEMRGDVAIWRPRGRATLADAADAITAAVARARARGIRKLVAVTLAITGIAPPDTTERFTFATAWARAAGGLVALAIVARVELIDPKRFGVLVATNRGLVADVFDSEEAALHWLRTLP